MTQNANALNTGTKDASCSEIIPRLYMKLLPVQIVLVIIGGVNSIIAGHDHNADHIRTLIRNMPGVSE